MLYVAYEELGRLSTGCPVNSFAPRKGSLNSPLSESVTVRKLLYRKGEKKEVVVILLRFAIVTRGVLITP